MLLLVNVCERFDLVCVFLMICFVFDCLSIVYGSVILMRILAMALNALSAFLYGISNFWLLLVHNTLGGLMYSLAFSILSVGIAVRFSGCQDAIGPDSEDLMGN